MKTIDTLLAAVGLRSFGGYIAPMSTVFFDCGDNSAPPPDPQIGQSLLKQAAQGDRLLTMAEDNYQGNKVRQVEVDKVNKAATDQAMRIADKGEERADETYNFYKTNGRPVVQQTLDDAKNFDSQGNIDAYRGRATADTQQAFDNSDQQNQRALARMGVNPSSGRFMALQQSMAANKAAAMAGAATNAETGVRQNAIGLRQQASNLASGMPAQSMNLSGQSLQGGAQGATLASNGMGMNMAIDGQRSAGVGQAASIYGNAAGGYNNLYSNQLQANRQDQQASSAGMAGFGNLLGIGLQKFAHGGTVGGGNGGNGQGGALRGSGSGTSDSIPAVNTDTGGPVRLSNGEYVVSADTVKALGTAYFDKLQAKHHKPVNLGRGS